jgi:hypothetical protein
MVVEQRAQQERMESDARVAALEATHRKRAIHGAIFWIVALGLCLGLTALALVVFGMASRGGQ